MNRFFEDFNFVKSDAKCGGDEQDSTIDSYLSGELSLPAAEAFEKHLEECSACGTDVANWQNIEAAVLHFGINIRSLAAKHRQ